MNKAGSGVLALLLVAVAVLFSASAADAAGANFSWSGAAGSSSWSGAANWAGGVAPAANSTTGTVSFPALGCAPAAVCVSNIDVAGVTVGALNVDDATGYVIGPASSGASNADLVIGSGGLSASTAATSAPTGTPVLGPVDFLGSQTWSVDGGASAPGVGGLSIGRLTGRSTGSGVGVVSPALEVELSDAGFLHLAGAGADNETGAFSAVGADTSQTGAAAVANGTIAFGGSGGELNSGSTLFSRQVSLTDVALTGPASLGPLSATGSLLGFPTAGSTGIIQVQGAATLGNGTLLDLPYVASGASSPAGTDFAQLNVNGALSLNGASLSLFPDSALHACPSLVAGDSASIVTAVGRISGTFSGLPNGTDITPDCVGQAPTVQIAYTNNTVTATVESSGGPAYPTRVTLSATSTSPSAGSTIQLIATVTPANPASATSPAGTIDFFDNANPIGSCMDLRVNASSAGSAPAASCTITVPAGPQDLAATFTPSSAYWSTGTSNAVALTPANAGGGTNATSPSGDVTATSPASSPPGSPTLTRLTASADPQNPQLLVATATVATHSHKAPAPTGTVSFFDGYVPIPGCSGLSLVKASVTCSSALQIPGVQTVYAVYAGNATLAPSAGQAGVRSSLSLGTAQISHLTSGGAASLNLSLHSPRAAITGVRLQFITAGISFTPGATFMSASGALRLRASGALAFTVPGATNTAFIRLGSGSLKLGTAFPRTGAILVLVAVSFRHGPEADLLVTLPRS